MATSIVGRSMRYVLLNAALLLGVTGARADPVPEQNSAITLHIEGVQIMVADIQRSLRFYTEVLGLKVSRVFPDGPQTSAHELLLSVDGSFDLKGTPFISLKAVDHDTADQAKNWPGLGHIILIVANTDAMVARATAKGYSAAKRANHVALLTDPDGYIIELLQDATL
jgi:catechol 2,3-dioxygenase-like lactoylglutathione lyase family enzyme